MNPLTIRATNLRTFETLDLDLPTGCVVIGGENGAGKSTILNAIDVALFAGRGELPALLSLGEDELRLELTFEHGGELYRVRRGFKGRKTTLDLEHQFDGDPEGQPMLEWEPLTRETADQTQQHLEKILGLSRATFRASSFLAQGDGAAFTDATPRDRKAILAEILGLDIYDRLLLAARTDLRVAEDATVAARARVTALEQEIAGSAPVAAELATVREQLTGALEQQAAASAELERAQQAYSANAAAVERLRAAGAALAVAQQNQERARAAYAAAVQAGIDRDQRQTELDQAALLADRVPELEHQLANVQAAAQVIADLLRDRAAKAGEISQRELALERMVAQADQLRTTASQLRQKADHLEAHIGESAACDRCGQNLGAEAAARAARSYRAEAVTLDERAAPIEQANVAEQAAIAELRAEAADLDRPLPEHTDPAPFEAGLRVARAAAERRATLVEQVRQLAEQAAGHDALALALAAAADDVSVAEDDAHAARAKVGDEQALAEAVAAATLTVNQAARAVTAHREQIARLEVIEQRARAAGEELATITAGQEATLRQIDVLKLAERAFGRDGIPALIVENAAIPQLELEANRILGELGGATAGCRVELRTQRLLKTTESLRETLDIVIVTPTGERAYETFSGGERTRLNLALRIALARLLAHRRGAESRLLAIDEPDGLDAQGMDALASILRGLSADFERVLVVSHQPQLATSFDQTLLVVKDGDRSRIDVAEAVLA